MLIYTYFGFAYFRYQEERKKEKILNVMFGLMIFMHLINHVVIYLNTNNIKIFILYGSELLMLMFLAIVYRWVYPKINELVLQHMMMLLTIGFVFLGRLTYQGAIRHIIFVGIGIVSGLIVPFIIERFKKLINLSYLIAAIGILLLGAVLLLGKEINGAKNWLVIGGYIKIQPSEFVKLCFVFSMAGLLSKVESFKQVVIVSAIAATHVLILVLETDLGGALIFFITYIIMLVVATRKRIYLFAGLGAGALASVVAYHLFSHVRVRVLAFVDPWSYIDSQGYQVAQALFAIGTGGWLGLGLTQGLPSSIPVVTSDFIFAAISEEMGAIYAICLILICMSCFIMIVNIAMKLKDPYYKLIALGFGVMYAVQVFLNIGGVTKMIPSTGVTLPLISSGGSSMLMTIVMFNVIQGLYLLNEKNNLNRRKEKKSSVVNRG